MSVPRWSVVAPERQPVHGGRDYPSVRYSAMAVAYKGELIMTHGYFYNHAIRHPAWQSDAWAFNLGSYRWRKLHEGERHGAPSARYSATAVLYDDALWMYGGDDGGHKTSMFNYVFQAWFEEMWRFDLRTYVWHKVKYNSACPSKRALHSSVAIGTSMYVYGGLELADLWRYDFGPSTWTRLMDTPAEGDATHPGRRHAFSAASLTDAGFFIFGGCRHVRGKRPMAFNDLWYYDISSNRWTNLAPQSGLPSPSARSHLSLLALASSKLLLYGGALCIPGCTCHGDSWVWDTLTSRWTELNATDAPIHRYRQNLVAHQVEGAVYLFGGESYRPYMYHNAVDKLMLPLPIAQLMTAEASGNARAAATAASALTSITASAPTGRATPISAAAALSTPTRASDDPAKVLRAAELQAQGATLATKQAIDGLTDAMGQFSTNGHKLNAAAGSVANSFLSAVPPIAAMVLVIACVVRVRRQRACKYGKYKAVGSYPDDD